MHRPLVGSNSSRWCEKGCVLLLLQLLMIFEACGQWELLFVIWRFFTVEYISLYGARFDPCAVAKKGQTIIFLAPCGRKKDSLVVVVGRRRSSLHLPQDPKQLLDLLCHFPLPSFLIELHVHPATSRLTAKSNYCSHKGKYSGARRECS